MPNRGMWIMKTCTCRICNTEKQEDGFYPSEFLRGGRCIECMRKLRLGQAWTKWRGWVQKTWGITQKQFIDLPKDVRLKRVAIAREALKDKVVSLVPPKPSNIAPFSYPPEHKDRLERDGSTVELAIKARKENKKDGFPYVLEHPYYPGRRKLGYSYNPRSRLSTYNVGCPYKLFSMPYISVYLEDAALAEATVQETLKEYHVSGEWYEVSRELAIKTIEDYVESLNDRKEQAMG